MAPSRGPQPLPRTLHQKLANHKGAVHVARYSKGTATYVLTGGADRSVRLWNANLGTEIKAFQAHGYEVLSICVSHDNSKFASAGGDRSVFLWDVTAGVTTRRIPGHMGKINTVEFNEDATVLASGSYDATVKLWDLRTLARQPIQVLDEARDAIQTMHVGPTSIITGSVDGHVRTYDLRKGELRADYIGHPITSILPTTDLQTLLVSTLDSRVRLLDLATGKVLNTFGGHSSKEYKVRACFGAGEATVCCGDEEGRVWMWDLVDATILQPNPPPKAHEKVITWTEYHPTNPAEMITASADGTCIVWRHPT